MQNRSDAFSEIFIEHEIFLFVCALKFFVLISMAHFFLSFVINTFFIKMSKHRQRLSYALESKGPSVY